MNLSLTKAKGFCGRPLGDRHRISTKDILMALSFILDRKVIGSTIMHEDLGIALVNTQLLG